MASQLRGKVVGSLRGFSGTRIEICRDEGITFVRKFARGERQLDGQVSKIRRLQSLSGRLFDVPTIWRSTPEYYELEYLRSVTLEERLQACSIEDVDRWAARCADIVRQLRCEPSVLTLSEGDYLSQYLRQLDGQYPHYSEIMDAVELLDTTPSFSHGDLTLDNILITPDNELFLIDPSMHRFDTYQWDVAKLLQSCYAKWWEIRGASGNRSRRLGLFCKLLLAQLLSDVDLRTSALYLAIVLLRIVPYANGQQKIVLTSRACAMLDQYLGKRSLFTLEENR